MSFNNTLLSDYHSQRATVNEDPTNLGFVAPNMRMFDGDKDVTGRTHSGHGHATALRFNTPPPCLAGLKIYSEARQEFERIKQAHRVLAPTGCTPEFCQSGRATRLNEPRVGRDRPISEIQDEAIAFLRECRDQGIIESDSMLDARIQEALDQIKATAVESTVTDSNGNQSKALAGGYWNQNADELEYGIRASWRNSRRCIMRSKYEQLALCDLRHITSSRDMAETIANGMLKAFNGGRIVPTTFVFPPRHPTKRGPMVWNNQILAFAGYRLSDGTTMGDPANADLTEAIIELGWKPPTERSPWDFLPIVTMADGEAPYILELPPALKRTISITHPRYRKEFEDLGLRWVLAPALSRLGFDIGGNQYTATPFIGWFMDAEIGVRNLADISRYNALPRIVKRLHLSDDPDIPFEDLPEFMRLSALSRAQTELNFAVYYSYLHEKVTMVDSLTSSTDYQQFDQERKEETGFRLPADPYWLSPPQGSIIPLWHQGAAPNYQPKPMICRHVQDPVKAWKRERIEAKQTDRVTHTRTGSGDKTVRPKIKLFTCSAGVSAGKMAKKLHERLRVLTDSTTEPLDIEPEKALNSLHLDDLGPQDIVLIIASTTGRGEMPSNATKFVKRYQTSGPSVCGPRFSVFGNGDTTYATYNAAAIDLQKLMERMGCKPLLDKFFEGDTAVNNPDWASFFSWLEIIESMLQGQKVQVAVHKQSLTPSLRISTSLKTITAELVSVKRYHDSAMIHVQLDLGDHRYQEMDHIKILPPNEDQRVLTALAALNLHSHQALQWHEETAYGYLSRHVDLSEPFRTLDWYPDIHLMSKDNRKRLTDQKASDVLASLRKDLLPHLVESICRDMSIIQPRLFSVASSPVYVKTNPESNELGSNLVDIIVKVNHGGRFSDSFLGQAGVGAKMRLSLSSLDCWHVLQNQEKDAPLIAITTGSGIGPFRALLQRRLAGTGQVCQDLSSYAEQSDSSSSSSTSSQIFSDASSISSMSSSLTSHDLADKMFTTMPEILDTTGSISLFAGFKEEDTPLINEIVEPAIQAGVLGILELVPSNSKKIRVQDHLLLSRVKVRLAKLLKHPACVVLVCANEGAAKATVSNLSRILGGDIKDRFGERYIEEIFRY